ncbi:bcl2-associated agonist of cell death [Gracilinanus agilis]|uniref:bcl2-associated agonist of cell death n=1 Tax=Gracilinanus agilis TaxID=191870 RepID=UPI001CFD8AAE|nr:bcl2-associated agonist of cell death [Gracilinanus agilis]
MTVSLTQATGAGLPPKQEGGGGGGESPGAERWDLAAAPREPETPPGKLDDASRPVSMFQIPEFEPGEQEDGSEGAPGQPGGLGRRSSSAPGAQHHEGAGDRRPRLISYPPLREGPVLVPEAGAQAERAEAEEDRGQFRSRSSSAPPILWAARRYGSELRRMSDEFDCSFKGLPRPKSAGTASQMRRSHGWTRTFQSWFGRNLGKGGAGPSH